ncbi:MAG: response regulator [Synechococcaceae cyanobacterium]|nr:response regulator [Synechococcaceae cyanobacterium]
MSVLSPPAAAVLSVAVVDDDPRLRQLLALELEDLGVAAICFPSAMALLNWEQLHQLQLVLLDLVMPEMDGLSCLIQLRRGCFSGKVVVFTANWECSRAQELLRAGADDCWNKTAVLERLGPLVEQLRQPSPPQERSADAPPTP